MHLSKYINKHKLHCNVIICMPNECKDKVYQNMINCRFKNYEFVITHLNVHLSSMIKLYCLQDMIYINQGIDCIHFALTENRTVLEYYICSLISSSV